MIGIIIYSYINSYNTFSIGIPVFDYSFVNNIYTQRISIIQQNIEHIENMLSVRHNVGTRGRFTTRIIDQEYTNQLSILRNRLEEIQGYDILQEDAIIEQIEQLYVILLNDYLQYMDPYCAANHRIG
ncbi:hypothetical protein N8569_00435 [bacterium]|nr:hypothetical protein [bacterium]